MKRFDLYKYNDTKIMITGFSCQNGIVYYREVKTGLNKNVPIKEAYSFVKTANPGPVPKKKKKYPRRPVNVYLYGVFKKKCDSVAKAIEFTGIDPTAAYKLIKSGSMHRTGYSLKYGEKKKEYMVIKENIKYGPYTAVSKCARFIGCSQPTASLMIRDNKIYNGCQIIEV